MRLKSQYNCFYNERFEFKKQNKDPAQGPEDVDVDDDADDDAGCYTRAIVSRT